MHRDVSLVQKAQMASLSKTNGNKQTITKHSLCQHFTFKKNKNAQLIKVYICVSSFIYRKYPIIWTNLCSFQQKRLCTKFGYNGLKYTGWFLKKYRRMDWQWTTYASKARSHLDLWIKNKTQKGSYNAKTRRLLTYFIYILLKDSRIIHLQKV